MFVIDSITHRLKRGCETMAYPKGPAPALPDRHGGALRVDATKCAEGCRECVPVCPTEAIARVSGRPVALDLGRCIFCAACVEACPSGAITQTNDHRMAVRSRDDLILGDPAKEEVRLAVVVQPPVTQHFSQASSPNAQAAEAPSGRDTTGLGATAEPLPMRRARLLPSPRPTISRQCGT